jgi:hypothetical protein
MSLLDDRPENFEEALDDFIDKWIEDEGTADIVEALAKKIRELGTEEETGP